jgi:hypothetical protein
LAAIGRHLPGETEDAVEENKSDADESEEEELDRWLLAGEETAKIRSYKNSYEHTCKNIASSFHEPSPRNWLGRDVVRTLLDALVDID